MRLYLVRCNTNKDDPSYYLTNYIPRKAGEGDRLKSVWFWSPLDENGKQHPSFMKHLDRCHYDPWKDEVIQLGGEIPCGSVKDLSTGEIIAYENLPSMDDWGRK